MQDIDDEQFAAAMDLQAFEPSAVASHLGVSRTSVYRRIEASAVFRLASEVGDEELLSALTLHNNDSVSAARELRVSHAGLRQRARKPAQA